jgi:hypothetical protein
MRSIVLSFFVSLIALILTGCEVTPGKSPSEIQAAYSSPGYVHRDFNDMHPDIPGQ